MLIIPEESSAGVKYRGSSFYENDNNREDAWAIKFIILLVITNLCYIVAPDESCFFSTVLLLIGLRPLITVHALFSHIHIL